MQKIFPKILIVFLLIIAGQGVGNLSSIVSMETININPSDYTLGVEPEDSQIYEIKSIKILQPNGSYLFENTTSVMVGGVAKQITLRTYDKIKVKIININDTVIEISQQYQLVNGSIINSDPLYQSLAEFTFNAFITTTNTSLIGDVITQANLADTVLSSSSAYFENQTILSIVSGLTYRWHSEYEFPTGWLDSILIRTYNNTINPITYYKLGRYIEPEPEPFAVNPDYNTLGVTKGDEQILYVIMVDSSEPIMELEVGYQLKFKVQNISLTSITLEQQTIDKQGSITEYLDIIINRSILTPSNYLLTTNVSLIHEVFDSYPDMNVSYTSDTVELEYVTGLGAATIEFRFIFDLQTGWVISYHLEVYDDTDSAEILMVAEPLLPTATITSTSTTSSRLPTTIKSDSDTTTTTTPTISPFPEILSILLSAFVIIVIRRGRK